MRRLLQGALNADDCRLSVRVQQRALRSGIQAKDYTLLAALAATPHLDPDVDAALGEVNVAKVRQAWIARPGRSTEQLITALSKEKRIGALAAFGAVEGLPDEVYDRLAHHDKIKVVIAVAKNPTVPTPIRVSALRRWAVAYFKREGTYQEQFEFSQTVKLMPEFTDAGIHELVDLLANSVRAGDVISISNSGRVTTDLFRSAEMSSALQDRTIDSIVKPMLVQGGGNGYQLVNQALNIVKSLVDNPSLELATADRLRVVVSQVDPSKLAGVDQSRINGVRSTIDVVLRSLDTFDQTTQAARYASSLTDPAAMLDALEKATKEEAPRVAWVVLHNPNRNDDVIRAAAAKVASNSVSSLACEEPDNLVLLTALGMRHHWTLPHIVAAATDKRGLVRSMLRAGANPNVVSAIARTKLLDAELVMECTPAQLTVLAASIPELATEALDRIEEALTGDAEWDLLDGLWDTYDGTIQDLIDAVGYLDAAA